MQRSTIIMALAIGVALFLLYRNKASPGSKKWTVYGTMGCGWTRKQLEHMKKVKKPFTFVDCDKGNCEDVDAFPTIVAPNGEKHVGYKEV